MPTVTPTLLNGASNGFSLLSQGGFDSAAVTSNKLVVIRNPAITGDMSADFQQGATANKYSDLGVPSGALVTGIKLLGASRFITLGATATGAVQFYTDEADLGYFDISSIGESSQTTINKTADDYVRLLVSLLGHVEFDPSEGYGLFEIQLYSIQLEITYQEADVIQEDSANVSDTNSVTGEVTFADSASVSDTRSVDGNVTLAESSSVSESISVEGTVSFADSANASETLSVEGDVSVSDNSSTGEIITPVDITAGDSQLQTDSVNVSESLTIEGVSIQFEDSVQIGDSITIEGEINLTDSARTTDTQSYEASLVNQSNTYVDEVQNSYYL